LDPTLLAFVVNAQCNDESSTPFTSLTALNCQCPSASILPCSCQPTAGISNSSLTIDCSNQGLEDNAMNAIVDNIPATTPVDTMDLSWNKLTQIPTGLPQYKTLAILNISSNLIEAVNEGELSLNGSVVKLDISFNVITKISPNSLPGMYKLSQIYNLKNDDDLYNIFKNSILKFVI
jgi:Leucine-rich repeat (LRR) protein